MPPVPTENVSYCASKRGEPPAVPYEPCSLSSETCGNFHHGSCATRHAADARPNVAQRFAGPNKELPSRLISASMI